MGFVGGIIGTLITSLIQGFGFSIRTQSILSTEYSVFMKYLLIFISVFYLIVGYIMNDRSFKGYSDVLKSSGHSLGDFIERFGLWTCLYKYWDNGTYMYFYVLLTKGVFNGPIVAGIVTVMAFAPFGKHPRNSIPIFIGVYLAAIIKILMLLQQL